MFSKKIYMLKSSLLFTAIVAVLFMSCNNSSPEENSENIKLFPVESGAKWGYIDRAGKVVIAPQFSKAECFHQGLAVVADDSNLCGYIDKSGNYKIKPQFKYAGYFSEGLASVVPPDGKPEYINKSGDVKITLDINEAGAFTQGLAAVMHGKKWFYIDKDGNMVGKDSFDYAFPFNEDRAAVMNIAADGRTQQWGYVDKSGAVVIPIKFAFARGFYEGKAYVSDSTHSFFINDKGDKVFDLPYDESGFFKNGVCIVKKGDNFGFIDETGKTIIPPVYKDAGLFTNNGLTNVKDSTGKWGFIDKTGKYVIAPTYDGATSFYGNVAFVVKDNKFGLIDDKGNTVLAPTYDDENAVGIHAFSHRLVETDYFENKLLQRNWKLVKIVGADGKEQPDSLHVQYHFGADNNFFLQNDNGTGFGTYDVNKPYRVLSMSGDSSQTESFVIEKLTTKQLILNDLETQDKYVFEPAESTNAEKAGS
jgi:hypothetical protein